jgi:hypothetical protein
MKKQTKEFVQTCLICQRAKPDRSKYPGLLEPLPTPDAAWQTVTMDFIEGLPTSGTANSIMVVVDKYTRYAHFIPLHHPFTAAKVAAAYMTNVFKLHSLPKVMISDRDPIFTSRFWKELFELLGSELRMSSAYHPQTDGQSERVNQCLEIYLRCFTHACPTKWSQYLAFAEYWYNTSYHSAIQMSPFVALYGHEPRHWGLDSSYTCSAPSLEEWLDERKHIQLVLQQNLHRARQYMKNQADKKRTERKFELRDEVFVKLQPYVQSSVTRRSNQKFACRYFGPYSVIKIINPVAYEVALPQGSKVHPVFHVSQLHKVLKPGTPIATKLPDNTDRVYNPVKILAHRWRQTPTGRREQVQVQWPPDCELDITWEDKVELQTRFPDSVAWGQAIAQGGRDVSSSSTAAQGEGNTGPALRPTRPSRDIRPNRRHCGPEWTK